MYLGIYSKSTRKILGEVVTYNYVTYTKEFNGRGSFELRIPTNEYSLNYLVFGNYIYFEEGVVGIVKGYRESENSDVEIIVYGYLVNHLLEYRSFLVTTQYYDYINNIARSMVNDLIINPIDVKRKINFIQLGNNISDFGSKIRVQNTGRTLYDFMGNMLAAYELGYDLIPSIIIDNTDGNIIEGFSFVVKKPVDRTLDNTDNNDPVLFSFDLNNLLQFEYENDGREYRSTVIIASEGEEEERKVIETGNTSVTGIDRIELYVDARDLQTDNPDEPMTDEELEEAMEERGLEKLEEHVMFESVDGTIATDGTSYKYGVDFDLGDYVTVHSSKLNKMVDMQITRVTKSISEGVEHLDIEFGKDRLSVDERREG